MAAAQQQALQAIQAALENGPIGSSQLTIPVNQDLADDALPANEVAGGILTPLKPFFGEDTFQRDFHLVRFDAPHAATRLLIRRLRLRLPVMLGEAGELETETDEIREESHHPSEAEAEAAAATYTIKDEEIIPIGPDRHYEKRVEQIIATEHGGAQSNAISKVTISRSVLPITIIILARLVGPDGELWSDSFETPIRYVSGPPSTALGAGFLNTYADLTNPLTIDPNKLYGLGFSVLVPTHVKTIPGLGQELSGTEARGGEHGEATFFYDILAAPAGK